MTEKKDEQYDIMSYGPTVSVWCSRNVLDYRKQILANLGSRPAQNKFVCSSNLSSRSMQASLLY